ncbi:hypothetical protein ACVWXQ_006338 [Bradyrhizobium sp. S3.14.4]
MPLLTIALPFDEWSFDMMLGDEPADDLGDAWWHRHGFDQIAACIGKRLALRRIGRDREQLVGRLGAGSDAN